MNLDAYQKAARETAIYPETMFVVYPALGLAGEVGEFCNTLKKSYRDSVPMDRDHLAAELGDILWYLAVLAGDLDMSLDDIAMVNLNKLRSRKERGKLSGNGDDR